MNGRFWYADLSGPVGIWWKKKKKENNSECSGKVCDISRISQGGYGQFSYFRAVNAYSKIVGERCISEACLFEDVWKSGHIILYSWTIAYSHQSGWLVILYSLVTLVRTVAQNWKTDFYLNDYCQSVIFPQYVKAAFRYTGYDVWFLP